MRVWRVAITGWEPELVEVEKETPKTFKLVGGRVLKKSDAYLTELEVWDIIVEAHEKTVAEAERTIQQKRDRLLELIEKRRQCEAGLAE